MLTMPMLMLMTMMLPIVVMIMVMMMVMMKRSSLTMLRKEMMSMIAFTVKREPLMGDNLIPLLSSALSNLPELSKFSSSNELSLK